MKVYFDTSAFAKRYIQENGSEQVAEVLMQASQLALSTITLPEIISALTRSKKEKRLSSIQYQTIKTAIYEDIVDITLYPITDQVIFVATQVIEETGIKALDAIHIASAHEWLADCFVSADNAQAIAAEKMKLKVFFIK